ncbi:hypothetical protein CK203_107335 [Vitis vinifera]|uniref:Uncharacterized protein n=1 Tax=Vitis vinifera TaxID=29760 RepID=A0A438CDK9_VITVI|nr:hypothetical protein CK203_107335 [Vitis vinifera]
MAALLYFEEKSTRISVERGCHSTSILEDLCLRLHPLLLMPLPGLRPLYQLLPSLIYLSLVSPYPFRVQRPMSYFVDINRYSERPCQKMEAIRAHQDHLIATQTQHTTILRQIQ